MHLYMFLMARTGWFAEGRFLGRVLDQWIGDAQEFIDHCGLLGRLGFAHVIVNIPNVHEIKPLEVLAKDVLPAIAKI